MSGPTAKTVEIVRARDSYRCVVCGASIHGQRGWDWSIQHRQARQMGGCKQPYINAPSNLLLVCGSGTTGCHGRIESDRDWAKDHGWNIPRPLVPIEHPALLWPGDWLYLTDNGHRSETSPMEVTT